LERSVSSLGSGALLDYLKRYINEAGVAIRQVEDYADPAPLDVILANTEAIIVLTQELKSRVKDSDYSPAPNQHLQFLVERFQLQHAGATPPGVPAQP
jgi:hypothetical protein